MGRLEGRIAVVTGAARGMGASTAELFLQEGAHVVLADQLPESESTIKLNSNALYVALDISSETEWRALDAKVREHFGVADILINNAGILKFAAILEMSVEDFDRCLQVNLVGTFLGIKTLAPGMIEKGKGSIVNISSTEGLQGCNAMAAYASSKWGIRGLTKVAAMELSYRGVRVNSVHPGPVDTPMGNPYGMTREEMSAVHDRLPIGRVADPMEIAKVNLFLAGDDSSFMTGAELAVDGGMTVGSYLDFIPGAPPRAKFQSSA